MKKIYLIALISMILIGCNAAENDRVLSGNTIEETNLHQHIATLASDEYGGRAPGSPGGEKTKQYLVNAFQSLMLETINGEYLLDVPLVEVSVDKRAVKRYLNKVAKLSFGRKEFKKMSRLIIVKWYLSVTELLRLSMDGMITKV